MVEWLCVRCFSCRAFQGQQKKKVNKFTCKMCREKQSVIKVYGISDKAKDIREMVMRLNMSRATEDAEESENLERGYSARDPDPHDECNPYDEFAYGGACGPNVGVGGEYLSSQEEDPGPFGRPQSQQSKWSSFVVNQEEENPYFDLPTSNSAAYDENLVDYVFEAPASSRSRQRTKRKSSSHAPASAPSPAMPTSSYGSASTRKKKRPLYADEGGYPSSSSRANALPKSSAFLPSASKKRKSFSSTAAGAKRGSFATRNQSLHTHGESIRETSPQAPSRVLTLSSSSSAFRRENRRPLYGKSSVGNPGVGKAGVGNPSVGKAHLSALSRAASETSAFFELKKPPPQSDDSFQNFFDQSNSETPSNAFDDNFSSSARHRSPEDDDNAFVMELPDNAFAQSSGIFGASSIGAFDAFQRESRAFDAAGSPGAGGTDVGETRAKAGKWGKYL